MIREARMMPALLRAGFALMVVYRAEIVIWILTTTMPLIMYALWSTLAREAPLGRFDETMFAAYFLAMLVVRQLSSAWVVWELNDRIRSGRLSLDLLRPLNPLLTLAADNLAAMPTRALVLIPIVASAVLLLPPMPFSAEPAHWLLAIWATIFSWLLAFLFQSMIGLLALYTQQSLAFQDAWFGIWALASGYLIPLEIFPGLRQIAIWLPFRSIGGLSTEIALGHLEGAALIQGLVSQLVWVAIALAFLTWWWPRAMRRFEAYGA
jgi:ABC-2 type transport system permease protein